MIATLNMMAVTEDRASWSPSQSILLSISLLVSLLICLVLRIRAKKQVSPFEGIPLVPGGHWFHGHLKYAMGGYESLTYLFSDHVNEEGLAAFWLIFPVAAISVLDARHARAILRQGADRKVHPLSKRHSRKALGDESLIFSEGGIPWMTQRRLVQYAFSALALVDYRPPTFEVVRNMVSSLNKMCKAGEASGKRVEINAIFLGALFTMDVFGKVAFGYNLNCTSDCDDYSIETDDSVVDNTDDGGELKRVRKSKEIKAFEFLLDDLMTRMRPSSFFNLGMQFYWIPTPRNREQKKQMSVVDNFLRGIIQERKNEFEAEKNQQKGDSGQNSMKGKRDNMLTRFIRMNEDATADDLIHSIKTLLIAGYETTSITIAFALYNLSLNPRCQERCAEEAKRIFDNYGDDYEGVIEESAFKYIYATVMESLRLNPTVLISQRKSNKVIKIGKTTVPSGTTIMIPLCEILKSERNFQRAKEFCPERWVKWDGKSWVERDARKEGSNHFKAHSGPKSKNPLHQEQNVKAETISAGDIDNYLAFSTGTRDCVGKRLARLEATIFIAFIMKDFIVEYDTTNPPLEMRRRMVTNFPHNLPIIFRRREW